MYDMNDVLEGRDDLQEMLLEVLTALFGDDEVAPCEGEVVGAGPCVMATLGIQNPLQDDIFLAQVQTSLPLARLIAARMTGIADPDPEDVTDAMAELGNIVAGNVKTLFFASSWMSLPQATVGEEPAAEPEDAVRVAAAVLGQPVELTVVTATAREQDHLRWPGIAAAGPVESSVL